MKIFKYTLVLIFMFSISNSIYAGWDWNVNPNNEQDATDASIYKMYFNDLNNYSDSRFGELYIPELAEIEPNLSEYVLQPVLDDFDENIKISKELLIYLGDKRVVDTKNKDFIKLLKLTANALKKHSLSMTKLSSYEVLNKVLDCKYKATSCIANSAKLTNYLSLSLLGIVDVFTERDLDIVDSNELCIISGIGCDSWEELIRDIEYIVDKHEVIFRQARDRLSNQT